MTLNNPEFDFRKSLVALIPYFNFKGVSPGKFQNLYFLKGPKSILKVCVCKEDNDDNETKLCTNKH